MLPQYSTTSLNYKDDRGARVGLAETEAQAKVLENTSNVDFRMVKNIIRNQLFLFAGSAWTSQRWGWEDYPWSHIGNHGLAHGVALGVAVGAILIGFGTLVEKSDKHVFADINKSTIDMTMRLFGRSEGVTMGQPSTLQVAAIALGLAALTGLCEETTFRGQIISALSVAHPGSYLHMLGFSSILFGVAHFTLGGHMLDAGALIALQTFNGLWFGLAFVMTGGDLTASIVAHALYDFQVLFNTWKTTNEQMDYAESNVGSHSDLGISPKWSVLSNNSKKSDFIPSMERWFYTLDTERKGTLGRGDVSRGLSFSMGWRRISNKKLDEELKKAGTEGRVTFPQFLDLVSSIKAERDETKRIV